MLDFWQAASSCIVPMTLISFCRVRPPTKVGVAMTFMWTTVSTPRLDDPGDHRVADVGADELDVADVARWRDDVDTDDPLDRRVGTGPAREEAPEVPGHPGHEHH